MNRLKQVHSRVEARIDYEPHWLADYDFTLSERDKRLKLVELARVEEKLKAAGLFAAISRWLDIGTGTGRYPLALLGCLGQDGKVIAIDSDSDCVKYASGRLQRELPDNGLQVSVVHADLLDSEHSVTGLFELITCTMGTLSHFGVDRRLGQPAGDGIQRALLKMSALLAPGGRLFLGTWSDRALGHMESGVDLLGIYKESDRRRLAKWSPLETELEGRLKAAGVEVLSKERPDDRLVLWECTPS